MAPERAVTPQDECRLSPKMSVPASPIAGTPIRDAQSPISMLLAVAQSQSRADDDLTNLNWLHERDILKGMNINPSPSNSINSTPMKVYNHEVVVDHSTPTSCTDESLESSDSYSYPPTSNNPTQITAPPRNKHPHNVPYDPAIHTSNKPPYSFSCLIFMAIEDSVQKALPVKEIYAWILDHFPYFKNAPTGWKNSVRHNLSLNKCFQKVEKAANLGKGSLWTVDPQYKPNLIQALNRSPFHPISTIDQTSYQAEKAPINDKPSVYRLPNPELFPYLARKLAATEMNNHIIHSHVIHSSGPRIKLEDSLDAVDAAAAMLSLKNSQPKNCDVKGEFLQVITNSPSQDHTYSAADSEGNEAANDDDNRIPKTRTCRKLDFEDDEDRRIKEGAETLLNLAGITLKKRHNSSSDSEEPAKRMRLYHRYDINKNEPPEEKITHFKPRLLRTKKKQTNRHRAVEEWGNHKRDIENNHNSSSDWEEDMEAVAVFITLNEENKKRRSAWVHEINAKREELGEYHRLVQELRKYPERFHMYFRMTKEEFDFVHELIKNDIQKENTQLRRAISTEERLAVCLRFLATGNSFRSIGFSYRMGFSTVREIIKEVCDAIWKNLGPIVMPQPTEETWKTVAAKYKNMWHFPNCIGAIDGKHINIQCPINAASTYYNYKGSHSIVLLALVDADYKFIAIDVGSYGRNSDGGIFSKSKMGKRLENKTFSVPEPAPLVENGEPQPYVVVGDEAFPLKNYLLRPYSRNLLGDNEPNKIFNYRLSRARRVVENAFGILAARWRCFRRYLEVQPEFVDKIVLASCCLHNMLCADNSFEPDIDSLRVPEAALTNVDPLRRNNTRAAFQIRENFKEFFNSHAGSVAWQVNSVRRGRIDIQQ